MPTFQIEYAIYENPVAPEWGESSGQWLDLFVEAVDEESARNCAEEHLIESDRVHFREFSIEQTDESTSENVVEVDEGEFSFDYLATFPAWAAVQDDSKERVVQPSAPKGEPVWELCATSTIDLAAQVERYQTLAVFSSREAAFAAQLQARAAHPFDGGAVHYHVQNSRILQDAKSKDGFVVYHFNSDETS